MKKTGLRGLVTPGALAGVLCLAGASASAQDAKPPPLRFGLDVYAGVSDIRGSRSFTDGMWAGSGVAYPSVLYASWDRQNDQKPEAHVALGIGRLYTGSDSAVDQPVEAWWKAPMRGGSVTVGKFYVPFALLEWEFETKPGVRLDWTGRAYEGAASINYNQNTRRANAYLRLGGAVGVSAAWGKGLSYDSDHDRGWGIDGTFNRSGWQITSEYLELRAPSSQRFHFGFVKLEYQRLGIWKPYLGRYDFQDDTEYLGGFRSTVLGLRSQAAPGLEVEGAHGLTGDGNVSWLQLHWTWER